MAKENHRESVPASGLRSSVDSQTPIPVCGQLSAADCDCDTDPDRIVIAPIFRAAFHAPGAHLKAHENHRESLSGSASQSQSQSFIDS
jgi:hypothetical protein